MLTRETYQIWAIDFIDGNLSKDQELMFLGFLDKYPDLKNEFEGMRNLRIEPEIVSYDGKDDLYRSEFFDLETFEQTSISYIENDLDADIREDFELFLSLHHKQKDEVRRFENTKFVPDESIVYHSKESLHKNPKVALMPLLIAACMIGIIISIGLFYFDGGSIGNPPSVNKVAIIPFTMQDKHPELILKNLKTDIVSYKIPNVDRDKKFISDQPIVHRVNNTNDLFQLNNRETALLSSKKEELKLVPVYKSSNDEKNYIEFRDYINQKSRETLASIGEKGMDAIKNITDDKVALTRDDAGKVKKFSLDTKFLAVSFPIGRNR